MTPQRLTKKIMELPPDTLIQEMSNKELESLVEKLIYEIQPEQELEVIIEPLRFLPCEPDTFKINGKDANTYDFGEGSSDGHCMDGTCCHRFHPAKTPSKDVLRKYGITESQFHEIGQQLANELRVDNCGCCSS